MLAMWTSTNIKNTKRTQMIPLHTGDEICPSFAHARLAASVFVMEEASAKAVVFGCLLLFHFSGFIKIDCKQHIPLCIQSLTPGVRFFGGGCHWRMIKNEVLPPDTMSFDGSSKDNWCYAWGSWGFPGDVWIWDVGLGSSWCFDSLEAQACRPYNLGYFGEGAKKKESGPASRHREGCP